MGTLILSEPADAQTVSNTLTYYRATAFTKSSGIGHLRFSGDGNHIIFDWSTSAGIYQINTDGSGLQLRFSDADMAFAVFGTSGREYNTNTAFDGLDVSDDGSRFLIATRQEGGAIVTWDGATFHTLHQKSVSSPRNETLTISGDGKPAAYVAAGSPVVIQYLRISDTNPEDIADTDDDGLTDLLEQAFGTDPNRPDAADGQTIIGVNNDPGDPVLTITFRRHRDGSVSVTGKYTAGGFVYSIESSDDMTNWMPVDDQILAVQTTPIDSVERATVSLATSLLEHGGRYLRIAIARDDQ